MDIFEVISISVCGVFSLLNGILTFFSRKGNKTATAIKTANDELQSKLQRAYIVCSECGHQNRLVDVEVHVPPVSPSEEVIKIG